MFDLEWSLKRTFLVSGGTCNTNAGAGNLSNILAEVYFMYLVCSVYLWRTETKSTTISDLTDSFFDPKFTTISEAVFRRCSVKEVFIELPQNSKENTYVRASFLMKLQALGFFFRSEQRRFVLWLNHIFCPLDSPLPLPCWSMPELMLNPTAGQILLIYLGYIFWFVCWKGTNFMKIPDFDARQH